MQYLDYILSTGFVPPSGTSQVSGQFVGAMNPSQHSTGGEQSLVAPSQHLQQGRSYVWSKTRYGCICLPAMVAYLKMCCVV